MPATEISSASLTGDGITDETVEFSALLDVAISTGQPFILEAGKSYLLDSWTTRTIGSKLVIRGSGATVIGPAATVNFLAPEAEIVIQDVNFVRWDSVLEKLFESGKSIPRLRFERNETSGFTGSSLNLEVPCTDYRIEDNYFHDNATSWNIRMGRDSYADTDNWSGIIRGNRIENVTAQAGGSLAGYAGAIVAYGRDTIICDNYIDTVTSTTGDCYGIYTKLRRGKVYGNSVQNITTSTGSDICGINLKGGERGGVDVYGYDTSCWGNTVLNAGSPGTKGVGIRAQSEEQKVFGNVIENFGLIGVNVDETGTSNNIVALNTIIGSGTSGETGAYITGGNYHVVRGNHFINCPIGVRVGSGTSQDGIVIAGNIFEVPASGTNLESALPARALSPASPSSRTVSSAHGLRRSATTTAGRRTPAGALSATSRLRRARRFSAAQGRRRQAHCRAMQSFMTTRATSPTPRPWIGRR